MPIQGKKISDLFVDRYAYRAKGVALIRLGIRDWEINNCDTYIDLYPKYKYAYDCKAHGLWNLKNHSMAVECLNSSPDMPPNYV